MRTTTARAASAGEGAAAAAAAARVPTSAKAPRGAAMPKVRLIQGPTLAAESLLPLPPQVAAATAMPTTSTGRPASASGLRARNRPPRRQTASPHRPSRRDPPARGGGAVRARIARRPRLRTRAGKAAHRAARALLAARPAPRPRGQRPARRRAGPQGRAGPGGHERRMARSRRLSPPRRRPVPLAASAMTVQNPTEPTATARARPPAAGAAGGAAAVRGRRAGARHGR